MTSFADPGSSQSSGGSLSRDVLVNLNADVSGYSQALGQAEQQTSALMGQVGKLSDTMGSLSKMAAGGIRIANVANHSSFAVAQADAALLENQLKTLRATSAVTGSSMDEMKGQLDAAFSKFPVSRAEVVQLAETISSLGVTAPKAVGSMTQTFLKLGAATGENPSALASSNLQLDRQMGHTDPNQVDAYANSLVTLSKTQGVAVSGITDFASAIAPMARAAGIGQSAVQGISTAFSKAGADGTYAASAFSSLITDMTTLSQTGSPDLAKYSSFVGKKTDAFRTEGGTQQAVDLFNRISVGDTQSNQFLQNLGYGGTRTVKAFQAVGQGGGLQNFIDQSKAATAAAGPGDNLDKAAAAADNGLADSMVMVRNQFTRLGEILGGPLLGFATKIASAFATVLGWMNKFVDSLGPIPGVLSDLASLVAGPLTFALSHFAVLGTLAMARTVLGPNSMPRVAYQAGQEAGALIKAGTHTREEAMALSPSGQRIAAGTANLRTQAPYEMGMRAAENPGYIQRRYGVSPLGLLGQGGIGAGRAAIGTATYLADERIRLFRDASKIGDGRSGNLPKVPGATLREHIADASVGNLRRATTGMIRETAIGAGSMGASMIGGAVRMYPRAAEAAAAREARIAATRAAAAVDTSEMSRREARAARSDARQAVLFPPVAPPVSGREASLAAAGVRTPPRPAAMPALVGPAADVGGVAARGGGLLARGVSRLAGAAFSPLGMIATTLAVPAISSFISNMKEGQAHHNDVTESLQGGRSQYDLALDQTSTHLAKFGDSVTAAADKLAKFANTPTSDLTTISDTAKAATLDPNFKVSDDKLPKLIEKAKAEAASPGGNKNAVSDAVGSWLNSQALQGPIDGAAFTKMQEDVYSQTGQGSDATINPIFKSFSGRMNQPGGIYATSNPLGGQAALAATVNRNGGEGPLDDYKNIMGRVVQGINGGVQDAGSQDASRAQLSQMIAAGAVSTGKDDLGQEGRIGAIGGFMQQELKIDPTVFADQVKKEAFKQGATKTQVITGAGKAGTTKQTSVSITSTDQAAKIYANAIAATPEGQAAMKQAHWTLDDVIKSAENGGTMPAPSQNQTNNSLKNLTGNHALGVALAGDSKITNATYGGDVGNPAAQTAAQINVIGKASKDAGGDMSLAIANMTQLSDEIDGGTGVFGKLAKSAANMAEVARGFALQDMSPVDRLNATKQDYTNAQAVANLPKASADSQARAADKRQAYLSEQETEKSRMIGQVVSLDAFKVSRDRAVAANTLQVGNTNRDFTLGQTRAAFQNTQSRGRSGYDFGLQQQRGAADQAQSVKRSADDQAQSVLRAQDDFGQQQQRAEDDQHTSLLRSQADFGQQQTRAVQDNNLAKLRAQQSYQLQSERSQQDYQTSVNRQTTDHLRDLQRQAVAASQDIYNPFLREQVKATTDAGTLIYNLKEQNADIERQMANLAKLKKEGISQSTIDQLKLGDAGNAQQTNTLVESLSQNPNMAKQINSLSTTRLADTTKLTQDPSANKAFRDSEADYKLGLSRASSDFTKSQSRAAADYKRSTDQQAADFDKMQTRAGDDYSKSTNRMIADFAKQTGRAAADFGKQTDRGAADYAKMADRQAKDYGKQAARAATDQGTTLDRMAADFKITTDNAEKDHATALSDMGKAFKLQQDQAAQDLATSLKVYSGDFGKIFTELTGNAMTGMAQLAPAATAIIITEMDKIKAHQAALIGAPLMAPISGGMPYGGVPYAAASSIPNQNATTGAGGWLNSLTATGHAMGGVSLKHHIAQISEHGPELILPLNSRGESFMVGLITRSLARSITTAISAAPAAMGAGSTSNDNSISFAGADIKVVAADPNKMARELAAKAKLSRLASPVRH